MFGAKPPARTRKTMSRAGARSFMAANTSSAIGRNSFRASRLWKCAWADWKPRSFSTWQSSFNSLDAETMSQTRGATEIKRTPFSVVLAVNEIPEPNRTPQQRSEKETGAKNLRDRMPPETRISHAKAFFTWNSCDRGRGGGEGNEGADMNICNQLPSTTAFMSAKAISPGFSGCQGGLDSPNRQRDQVWRRLQLTPPANLQMAVVYSRSGLAPRCRLSARKSPARQF